MAAETYLVESSATMDVARHERADFWSEHVGAYQSRLGYRFGRTDDFRGGTIRQCSPGYQLVEFWSDAIAYTRTARQVRQDDDGDYRLLVPLTGELVMRQDDRETRLAPGAGGLVTFSAPFELLHDSSTRAFVMTIPHRRVGDALNRSFPAGAGLDLSSGLGRVVGAMMTTLAGERDVLTTLQFDTVCDRLAELVCMLVAGDDRPDVPGHLAVVVELVRRFAREHADDPTLTGTAIAESLGWSLRQIQLALQHVGTTPRELIREERLRLARDRLRSPAHRHLTITHLAHASGFSSAGAFSTAFRRRFGVSPREMRHRREH
ncbi:helix-turn-helix domain-containing protein [Thermomonospora umbrina]|uniref:AraC family transcriptional regulator n=1 Tax=Thermomonospora umbrina TaxID=111806 RepID=A0A3D9SPN8_9ACTN|nr:helix-turn-helix domain-containing protein [Thermomonospora umbrina]REE96420.1 AraC family transcriptional regulator [Thermomonospora umbrina]